MDSLNAKQRSENMSRIRSKDTQPEMRVRKLAHRLGYRYRLHVRDLPGKPDLVFASKQKVIFVHGCFWHQHQKCREGRLPASRPEYWIPKLTRNTDRDKQHIASLRKLGWKVLTLWECEVGNELVLERKLLRFLR
jgi:DNA mismatch endonuclease (patch repair protein)